MWCPNEMEEKKDQWPLATGRPWDHRVRGWTFRSCFATRRDSDSDKLGFGCVDGWRMFNLLRWAALPLPVALGDGELLLSFWATIFNRDFHGSSGLRFERSVKVGISLGWHVQRTVEFDDVTQSIFFMKHMKPSENIWHLADWFLAHFWMSISNIGGSSTSTPTASTTRNVTIDSWQNTVFLFSCAGCF